MRRGRSPLRGHSPSASPCHQRGTAPLAQKQRPRCGMDHPRGSLTEHGLRSGRADRRTSQGAEQMKNMMLKVFVVVALMFGLTVAAEEPLRIRRGIRKFGIHSSRNHCTDRGNSKVYLRGETWLQLQGRYVKYCRCNGWKIRCHSVSVQDTAERCYMGRGTSYRGIWSTSSTHSPCLNWNLPALDRSQYNSRASSAQQWGLGNHNHCRNPDNDTMPWCHVYDRHVLTWAKCSLPACPQRFNTECSTKDGAEYRGTRSYSQHGRPCLSWDSEDVRAKPHNAWMHKAPQLGLGSHNYCRNPNADAKPWCHVRMRHTVQMEYCDIPQCTLSAENCGKRDPKFHQFRIQGGAPVDITSHPWQAVIYIYHKRGKTWNFLCGGSLIGSCWVLTAAHCFSSKFKAREMKVIMGKTIIAAETTDEQTMSVEEYFVHPEFTDETFNNDIALIKLQSKNGRCTKMTRHVRTVCLPQKGQHLADWTACEISGYGWENESIPLYSKQLKEGKVRKLPAHHCTPAQLNNRKVTENMICASDTEGTDDACKGDSGGPLVCQMKGYMTLQGIISWGIGCGRKGVPGVYTKVVNYLDWIRECMAKSEYQHRGYGRKG
ncbi:salivary plasminogen activator gamma isoform X2 [Narcine bancroftii]|uniref:salivary plasminogen activator gamma isoform X2 n=1 Tax=Narcine bancroftii TaxID=1343680 RepID=UPI003831F129